MANLSVRPHNSFCEVECKMVVQHCRNALFHERAIFRVYKSQIFFYRWRLATRIKTIDPKQLGGPVFESSCVEGPTSHMGNALRFTDIKLASLKRLIGAFAIFDVGRDPIPLDDVSIFISERHSAVQLPAVLPIRPAGTHLIFERLASSNRFHPFTCMSLKIIRVN